MTADTPEDWQPTYVHLDHLRQEIDALRGRVTALEVKLADRDARIAELEDRLDGESPQERREDRYDAPVLARIEEGQTVTTSHLTTLYRVHTDIKRDETIETRIRALTGRESFEYEGPGRWTYVGSPPAADPSDGGEEA